MGVIARATPTDQRWRAEVEVSEFTSETLGGRFPTRVGVSTTYRLEVQTFADLVTAVQAIDPTMTADTLRRELTNDFAGVVSAVEMELR